MGKDKGSRKGGGGHVDDFKSCDDVNIDGLLASQEEKALRYVKENDIVQLALTKHGIRDVVEVRLSGTFIGVLFANGLERLISCMKSGNPFYGIVTEMAGAKCRIWIRSGKPAP